MTDESLLVHADPRFVDVIYVFICCCTTACSTLNNTTPYFCCPNIVRPCEVKRSLVQQKAPFRFYDNRCAERMHFVLEISCFAHTDRSLLGSPRSGVRGALRRSQRETAQYFQGNWINEMPRCGG